MGRGRGGPVESCIPGIRALRWVREAGDACGRGSSSAGVGGDQDRHSPCSPSSASPRDRSSILPRRIRKPGHCTGVPAPNPNPTPGTTSPSQTSLDEDPRGPGLVLAGVPQVLFCFLRGPGAEQGERHCHGPIAPFTPFPPHSRQEILHFLHSDVPSGIQRGLQAAVGGVDGARREGSVRGPWGVTGQEGLGTARTQSQAWSRAVGHCVWAGTGWSLTVAVRGGVLALGAAWDVGTVRLWQLRCHR